MGNPVGGPPLGSVLRWWLAGASIGAGLIHASAASDHTEHAAQLTFFVVVALVQVAWGVALLRRVWWPLLNGGVALNAAVVGVWLLSRTVGLPVAGAGEAEPLGVKDGAAALLELGLVAGVASLVPQAGRRLQLASGRLASGAAVAAVTVLTVAGLASSGDHHAGAGHAHTAALGASGHDGDGHAHEGEEAAGDGHAHGPEVAAGDHGHDDASADHGATGHLHDDSHHRAGAGHGLAATGHHRSPGPHLPGHHHDSGGHTAPGHQHGAAGPDHGHEQAAAGHDHGGPAPSGEDHGHGTDPGHSGAGEEPGHDHGEEPGHDHGDGHEHCQTHIPESPALTQLGELVDSLGLGCIESH